VWGFFDFVETSQDPDVHETTSTVNAFTYGNFTFVDPSKSDAIDARRISCE